MERNKGDFWWRDVTGPKSLIETVVSFVAKKKNVVLYLPADLPYRNSMHHALHAEIEREMGSAWNIKDFDYESENPDNLNPNDFILKVVCENKEYRCNNKTPIVQYICDHNLLENKIICLRGITINEREWIVFFNECKSKGVNGIFIAEMKNTVSLKELNTCSVVEFDKKISNYDVHVFNTFILGDKTISDGWKGYIAEVASNVCGKDVEVSSELVEKFDFKSDCLFDALIAIAEDGVFSHRGESSNHILNIVRRTDRAEVNKRVWRAQVKILFPLIEQKRHDMIKKYENQLRKALLNNNVEYFDKKIEDPFDLEVGTFWHMIKKDHVRLVGNDKNRIGMLRDCRNEIAHMQCCLADNVKELLDKV